MEELDAQSKPSEETTNISDIPVVSSDQSMEIMEDESIKATMDTEREENSLESNTCHWRNMLKLCRPLSIQLTRMSTDGLKKSTVHKKSILHKVPGSQKNLIIDSRDYRSKKRKRRNVNGKFKYSRKKQKIIPLDTSDPDKSDKNTMLKSCTVLSTNDVPSASPVCVSEKHVEPGTIPNESAMDKVLDVPDPIEPMGKDDTSSVQCLNESTEQCIQVEKGNTETEESRYQEYVRNILMEYCYSYGNLSHMSKELNDDHSSDTKSTTGDKQLSNENDPDEKISSWSSRKKRKKVHLNSPDTIVNKKSPKKQRHRNQKNLTSTPTKANTRPPGFSPQTKSPSRTPLAAQQEQAGKTSANSSRELKIQLMKLEAISSMYVATESADGNSEYERDVSSIDNENSSTVCSEGISDAETVVNPNFTEESGSGIEFQESDHDLDTTRIIEHENTSVFGSEISDVNEMDIEIVERQRKASASPNHQKNEAENCINKVDKAIDIDAMLRLKYGIRQDLVVLLEKCNPPTYYDESTREYQYDYDVSDVLEASDSSSSDSDIFRFVRKGRSPALKNRRISSSSEEDEVSLIKPVSSSISNKDKDAKNTKISSRTSNTREELSEISVTNRTSSICKDTPLEGSERVTKIATSEKKKVSQPENTRNTSPKNVTSVQTPNVIESNSNSSDSEIQIISVTMNSNNSPRIYKKVEVNSPSPKKSTTKLRTDNNTSVTTSQTNRTPVPNIQTPVKDIQTPSSSKISPVSTAPKLSCHICNRKYVRKRSLRIHMDMQHSKESSEKSAKPGTTSCTTQESISAVECLDCGICSRKFITKKAFVDHIFSHQSEAQQDYRIASDRRSRSVWLDLYGLKDKNAEAQHNEQSKKDPSPDKRHRKEEQIISSLTTSPKEVVVCSCHPNNGVTNKEDSSIYIEMVLLCEYCKIVFRRKECLETHYRTSIQCSENRTSGRTPKLYCTACNVTVESLSVLCHHLEMHPRLKIQGTVTFLCNICKVIFFGIGSIFRRHWFSHIKNPLFVASRYSFPKLSVMKALGNHSVYTEEKKQVAHAAELAENIKYVLIAEHVCRSCKLPFGSENDLNNHLTSCSSTKNTSTVAKPLNDGMICCNCQKIFTDKNNYDIHVDTCRAMADGSSPSNSKDTAKYTCSICQKTCQTKDQLTRHQNNEHSADLYLCSRCGISFSTVEHFTAHTQVNCTICDNQFDCQKRYQDHLSSHFTNLAISEESQESSTITRIPCETNMEVDKSTGQNDHVETTEDAVSSSSSVLQGKRSDQSQQSKSQNEIGYLVIREEVAKSPKKVVTITSEGIISNTSTSKDTAQQKRMRNEIPSTSSSTEDILKIVECQPDDQKTDPLASGQVKDTTRTVDAELPTDSSETSSTIGMPCGSNKEKAPRSGFLRVKNMSELLEKRDKESYICKTCGLPCTSAENLSEHTRTHVTEKTNDKTSSINDIQRVVDENNLRLLNQYTSENRLTSQSMNNIPSVTADNTNAQMRRNVNNIQQSNNNSNCGNTAAFIPCVICGTIFNATQNPVHCQPLTTSTGQVKIRTGMRVYPSAGNNQTQGSGNASTFNTAVRLSPFVEYAPNTIRREQPTSAVNTSANLNLNMIQQVTQQPQNSQWNNSTYSNTNVPIVYSHVPLRAATPYSAPNSLPNVLPKSTNVSTAATPSSHCIVPNPPMRPQYPYRAVSQSSSKAMAVRRSTSSSSSAASFVNNAQPVTTDASIENTRPPPVYPINYNVPGVPLQQLQSNTNDRTGSHMTRQPAHLSISQTIQHLPEQQSQLLVQQPAQLCKLITQPTTTQAGQQTSQQTTVDQPLVDPPRRSVFSCSSCKDFRCATVEELRLHRMRHTPLRRIQPRKSYCSSISDVELSAHSSSYSPVTNQRPRPTSNEPLYVCNGCHTFRTTCHIELQEHMKQHHKAYICQLCHIYKCKSRTQMQDHINLHINGKIAPHAVRHTILPDGKEVSKKVTPQLRCSPSSESSYSTGARSSPVDQIQPIPSKYAHCEFRSGADSLVLDDASSTQNLNSFSNNRAREPSGIKKSVYFFCKVCKPTPIFQTLADLHQHQANLHP